MYNLSALQNATGFGDLMTTANSFSDGMLLQLFLIAVFIIIILSLNIEDLEIKVAISSFVCFFIALMMTYAGWVYYMYPLIFILILALDLLYIYTIR
jgi:hypothetical protein